MTDRLRDEQLDHAIRSFLAWRAEDIADAPTATEVAMGIKARAGTRRGVLGISAQLAGLLIVGLLTAALIGAAVIGGNLLRDDRAPLVVDPPPPLGWTGPVRSDAAGMPVLAMTPEEQGSETGLHVDGRDSTLGWADIVDIRWQSVGPQRWNIELAERPPQFDQLNRAEMLITHGLVFDTTGDGVADYVIGINNDAKTPGHFRVWLTDLAAGRTDEQVGPPYGFPVEFSHPDECRPRNDPTCTRLVFTFLSGRKWWVDSSTRFYAWSSVTDHGEVVAWDYAPNFAWLEIGKRP